MFTTEQLTGLVRAALAAAGGGAFLQPDTLTQVAGALVVIVTAVWSVLAKRNKKPQ